MFARHVMFKLDPGARALVQGLADDLVPMIEKLPGCHGATVFGDDGDGQWGLFVLWATQGDADAAAPVIRPRLDSHLAGHASAPAAARLFEVVSTS